MNCYLCHRPLEWNEKFEQWECPFLIQDRADTSIIGEQDFFPHFHIDMYDNIAAYMNEFRVIEQMEEVDPPWGEESFSQAKREFFIYKWSAKYGTWQYITSIPSFKFQSEEHLLSKIKTILTFS